MTSDAEEGKVSYICLFGICLQMDNLEKQRLIRQILWDYTIPVNDIEALLEGEIPMAGHYNRKIMFGKILESYPWFTVLNLFKPEEVRDLLTDEVIKSLRLPSLRSKYEFVQRRLREIIPASG